VKVVHSPWELMGLTTRPGRSGFGDVQLSMDDVLNWLKRNVPRDAYGIAVVTTIDLFVPGPGRSEYIPGRSHYTQRHGACSLARLCSEVDWKVEPCSRGRFLRRCLKLTSHEVAHMFGLKHCVYTCRMAGTTSLEHHDATTLRFCSRCEGKLQHLLKWSASDLCDRATGLADVLANCSPGAEFDDEVTALRRRPDMPICEPCMAVTSKLQRGPRKTS